MILNLTTDNRETIFKKIFQEKVFSVKIILSAPFQKNEETVVIEENYDFRKAYKEMDDENKYPYESVLQKLKEK